MIDFLNALFEGEKIILDIMYSSTEYSGEDSKEKKSGCSRRYLKLQR